MSLASDYEIRKAKGRKGGAHVWKSNQKGADIIPILATATEIEARGKRERKVEVVSIAGSR